MSNIRNLLEKMDQFAGQAVGQKPGDQVRGTDKATRKKSGEHPFKGRLVGASESAGSLLRELQQELNKPEATVRRDLFREFAEFKQGMAEGLNEFAPSNGGNGSGRWYTDNQMTELVGDGWWEEMDISGASIGIPDGDLPKEYMMQQAQAWLDDQGYNVEVHNIRVNDDDCDWFITGDFHNPGFAKEGVTEEDAWHSSEDAPQDAWHSSQDTPQDAWHSETSESQDNPVDAVTMDVPLLIRIMEYAREDAKTDQDLHNVAEKLIAMSGGGSTLGMDQYDAIVGQPELDEEVVAPVTPGVAPTAPAANTAANPAAVAQMKAQQLKTLAAQKKSTQDQIKQTQEQLDALRKQLASLSNPANIAMPGVTGTAE